MRIKKGFTLAEILIVLMVIGVIATMTIPGLMKGVTEAQLKTGYKKGLNTIVNLAAMERISGSLPTIASSQNSVTLFESLNSNLSVANYVDYDTTVSNNAVITTSKYLPCVNVTDANGDTATFGDNSGSSCATLTTSTITQTQNGPWIVTEDNLAYTIMVGGSGSSQCSTKLAINGAQSQKDAYLASCNIVIVDVNGLSKGPNSYDPQIQTGTINTASLSASDGLDKNDKMDTLVGDQYPIFMGSDGATAGPKAYTVTGRIAADLK